MPAPKTPASRLLGALVAAGDPGAVRRLRASLARHRGSVKAAAADLGCSTATLHRWMVLAGIPGRGTPGRAPPERDGDG